jgi:hypothetical protein
MAGKQRRINLIFEPEKMIEESGFRVKHGMTGVAHAGMTGSSM